jgi:hypothetical protein
VQIVYADRYGVDTGEHVFHMGKYAHTRDLVATIAEALRLGA